MKIVVVSDTHGYFKELQDVIEKEAPFDVLMHCGDVCGHLSMALGDDPAFEVYAVAGNCDFPGAFPPFEIVEIQSHRILLEHGHRLRVKTGYDWIVAKAQDNHCDIALYGHTHVPESDTVDGVLVFNPGSLTYPRTADERPSYGVIHMNDTGIIRKEIVYLKTAR